MFDSNAILKSEPIFDGTSRDHVVSFDIEGNPLSYVFDDEWDFRSSNPQLGNDAKVDFLKYGERKEYIQACLYSLLKNEDTVEVEDTPVKSIIITATALFNVSQIIGLESFSALSEDKTYRKVIDAFKNRNYSEGTIERYLGVISKLHNAGLCDRFIKNPKTLAKKLGKPSKQHICLPESFASKFLNALLEFVEKYHGHRFAISKAYSEKFAYNEEKLTEGFHPATLRKIGHKKLINISNEKIDINLRGDFLSDVVANCMLLTMMLTGTRFSEANSFASRAYFTKTINGEDISFVRGITTKTNDGIPKVVDWVTHPIVKKALELAYHASEWSRVSFANIGIESSSCFTKPYKNQLDPDKTTPFFTPGYLKKKVAKFCEENKIYPSMDDIAEFDLINTTRQGEFVAGEAPSFSSHTFRRTFAVFLCRNSIGSLLDIKHQYKHLNRVMSEWYTNNSNLAAALDLKMDKDLASEIQRINTEVTANLLFEIYNSETLSGTEGERIKDGKMVNGEAQAYTLDDLKEIESGAISVVEHPFAYCLNPSCDRICNSELSSISCSHKVTTRAQALRLFDERERLINKFRKTNTGHHVTYGLLKHYQMKIEAAELTLSKHNIPATPFTDEIKSKPFFIASEA